MYIFISRTYIISRRIEKREIYSRDNFKTTRSRITRYIAGDWFGFGRVSKGVGYIPFTPASGDGSVSKHVLISVFSKVVFVLGTLGEPPTWFINVLQPSAEKPTTKPGRYRRIGHPPPPQYIFRRNTSVWRSSESYLFTQIIDDFNWTRPELLRSEPARTGPSADGDRLPDHGTPVNVCNHRAPAVCVTPGPRRQRDASEK